MNKLLFLICLLLILILLSNNSVSKFGTTPVQPEVITICDLTSQILLATSDGNLIIDPSIVSGVDVATAIYAGSISDDYNVISNYLKLSNLTMCPSSVKIPQKMIAIIMSASTNLSASITHGLLNDNGSLITDLTDAKTIIKDTDTAAQKSIKIANILAKREVFKEGSPLMNLGKAIAGPIKNKLIALFASDEPPSELSAKITSILNNVIAKCNEVYGEITAFIRETIGEAIDTAIAAGVDFAADLIGMEAEVLLESLSSICDGIGIVFALFTIGATLADLFGKYCPCDHPVREIHATLPICYKGTCQEEFGPLYVPNTASLDFNSSCTIDCPKTYGDCYYSNGFNCISYNILKPTECISEAGIYDNKRQERSTSPIQANASQCTMDSDACQKGYLDACPNLIYQPLYIISPMFKDNNVN